MGPGTGTLGRRKEFSRTNGKKNLVEIAQALRVKIRDNSLYEEPVPLVHKSALNSNIMRQLVFQEALKCSCSTDLTNSPVIIQSSIIQSIYSHKEPGL